MDYESHVDYESLTLMFSETGKQATFWKYLAAVFWRTTLMRFLAVLALLWGVLSLGYYALQIVRGDESQHGWSHLPLGLVCVAVGIGLLDKSSDHCKDIPITDYHGRPRKPIPKEEIIDDELE